MYRGGRGDAPDSGGAEGGRGTGGDVRVVLGVQLVIDGVLRAESPHRGQRGARHSPQPPCPEGLVQLGQDSFAYICIALLFRTMWLCSCKGMHLGEGG